MKLLLPFAALTTFCLNSVAQAVPTNLAPSGTATASSELGACCGSGTPFFASRAIDGNRDGSSNTLIFHSNSAPTPEFLEVNLGADRYLDRVQIFPRTNAIQGSVENFRLTVKNSSNVTVFSKDYFGTGNTGDVRWGTSLPRNVLGQTVRLERLDNSPNLLTFAEFEVWAQSTPVQPNLITSLPASQITGSAAGFGTSVLDVADGAIDGHYSHTDAQNGVTPDVGSSIPMYHSNVTGVGQFVQFDFGMNRRLDYVNLYSRTDTNSTNGVQLQVLDSTGGTVHSQNLSMTGTDLGAARYDQTYVLPANTVGRTLRVQTTANEFLALGEVEAFGSAVPVPAKISLADIVGGGDGTGTGTSAGIQMANGNPISTHFGGNTAGAANTFFPALHPMVDGVFTPDGNTGGGAGTAVIPVSSTGLTVTGINDSTGTSYDYIWNGHNLAVSSSLAFDTIIGAHASKGITFDLAAMRAEYPGFETRRFIGSAASGNQYGGATHYVLVDGVIAATITLTGANQQQALNIPLGNSAQFLTLMTLSNGSDGADWSFWGNAYVVPEPSGATLLIVAALALSRKRKRSCHR